MIWKTLPGWASKNLEKVKSRAGSQTGPPIFRHMGMESGSATPSNQLRGVENGGGQVPRGFEEVVVEIDKHVIKYRENPVCQEAYKPTCWLLPWLEARPSSFTLIF